MAKFDRFSSHFDMFENARNRLIDSGVGCEVAYAYQSDIAEATFTLKGHDGSDVASVKFSERWENFGDKKKPLVHAVYNYDVYMTMTAGGWLRVAFSQAQENRGVPAKIAAAIGESLNALARSHDLYPKVRALAFGGGRQ